MSQEDALSLRGELRDCRDELKGCRSELPGPRGELEDGGADTVASSDSEDPTEAETPTPAARSMARHATRQFNCDPQHWGIKLSQLAAFREGIRQDLDEYCGAHYVYFDGKDCAHVCRNDPCSCDDHRGVKFLPRGDLAPDADRDKLLPMRPNMHVVVARYLKPLTVESGRSYALMVNKRGLEVSTFISHCWAEDFNEFVDTLMMALNIEESIFVCSFALFQNESSTIARMLAVENLDHTPFGLALAHSKRLIIVVDKDLEVPARLWCNWEISRASAWGIDTFLWPSDMTDLDALQWKVDKLRTEESTASNVQDEVRIREAIAEGIGFEALDRLLRNFIGDRLRFYVAAMGTAKSIAASEFKLRVKALNGERDEAHRALHAAEEEVRRLQGMQDARDSRAPAAPGAVEQISRLQLLVKDADRRYWDAVAEQRDALVSVHQNADRMARQEEAKRAKQQELVMKGVTITASDFVELYGEALEESGGQGAVDARLPDATQAIGNLRRAREKYRPKQDVGFEYLGIEPLYAMAARRRPKFMQEVERLAAETHGSAVHADLKSEARARTKAAVQYSRDITRLTDILRASIVYRDVRALYDALIAMIGQDLQMARHDFLIIEAHDHFRHPTDGYRDIVIVVEVDGIVGEVQLHAQPVMDIKARWWDSFKLWRRTKEFLFEACVQDDPRAVSTLLRKHSSRWIGTCDAGGRSPLHYSCQVHAARAVRLLLEFRADCWAADPSGVLPLELALKAGHLDIAEPVMEEMLVQVPGDAGGLQHFARTIVPWWSDHVEHAPQGTARDTPQDLPPRGTLPRDTPPRDAPQGTAEDWIQVGHRLREILRKHGAHQSVDELFLQAARQGRTGRVRCLLLAGVDPPPSPEGSALDLATQHGHESMVVLLGQFQPQSRREGLQCGRYVAKTVHMHLRAAAQGEDGQYARVALHMRANPNLIACQAPGRRTPLMAFAASGCVATCRELVEHGARVDSTDDFGCCAVHYACALESRGAVHYLEGVRDMLSRPWREPLAWGRGGSPWKRYLCEAVKHGCCGAVWRMTQQAPVSQEPGTAQGAGVHGLLTFSSDDFGSTPLHLALQASCLESDPTGQVCRALVFGKADVLKKNSMGDTALHLAATMQRTHIYDCIFEAVSRQLGSTEAALTFQATDRNNLDQVPTHLMNRADRAICPGLPPMNESSMLLRAGFCAFESQALAARLEKWRGMDSPCFYQILPSCHRLRGLVNDAVGSTIDSDGSSAESASSLDETAPASTRSASDSPERLVSAKLTRSVSLFVGSRQRRTPKVSESRLPAVSPRARRTARKKTVEIRGTPPPGALPRLPKLGEHGALDVLHDVEPVEVPCGEAS